MMIYKIIWSPNAKEELEGIHFYIKYYLKEKNIADKIVKNILNQVLNLQYSPERYSRILYNKNRNIRRLLVKKYVIIYEVDNNTGQVFILHIFHSSQNYLNKI